MRRLLLPCLCALASLLPARAPGQPQLSLEVVAEVSQGPGSIAVTPGGRIVLSLHPFYAPENRVVELTAEGRLVPFPDGAWASGVRCGRVALDSVLAVASDDRGVVWMLDNGRRGQTVPKLVGWDTVSGCLARVIHLPPPITPADTLVHAFAVDTTHGAIYLADPAGGTNAALIVVDLATGMAHRVLEGHRSVVPEDVDLVIDGRPVAVRKPDGSTAAHRVGVTPIALDASDEWLYFGPMHGTSLYRLRTRDLRDRALGYEDLGCCVERYSAKPICEGIVLDREGNVVVSDLAAGAVGLIAPDRSYRVLIRDAKLSWPDGFHLGPDGYVYAVANQLHRSGVLNGGEELARPPFHVLRFPSPGRDLVRP